MRSSILIALLISALQGMAQEQKDLGPDELYSVSDVYINKNNTILLGATGGLYVSTDLGKSWKRPDGFRSSIYLGPKFTLNSKQQDLYMFGSSSGPDVYVSKDDGESWTKKVLSMPWLLSDVAVYGDTIFLGTYDKGLHVLKLDGSTVAFPTPVEQFGNMMITHIAFEKSLVVVSTRENGFYISKDRGATWQHYTDLVNQYVNDILIKNNRIFISYDFSGLFVSGDQGTNWVPKNGGLARTHIMDIYVEGDMLYLVTDGSNFLYQSLADEITDWTPISSPTLVGRATECVAAAEDMLVTASWDSVYTSTNGGETWHASIKGIRDAFWFLSIQAASDESLWAVASHTGVYKKSGTDEMFALVESGTNFGFAKLKGDSLAVISDYRIRMYNVITGEWGGTLKSPLYYMDYLEYAGDGFFVSTKSTGVHQYTGTQWLAFNTGLPDLGVKGFGQTGNTLFAGTAAGLFKTDNSSAQWTSVPFNTTGNTGVTKMIVDNTTIVVTGSDNNTYFSRDSGLSWKKVEELRNRFAYAMHVDGDSIYIGDYQTLTYSHDGGATWNKSDLGDYIITAIIVHDNKLYVGTLEHGIKEIALNNDQTITFEVTDKLVGDHPFALTATTTSGLPVVWSSSDPSVLSINGSGVAAVHKAGSVTIKATQQGNLFFKGAEAEKTITVSDPPPVITGIGESSKSPFSIYPIPCRNVLYLSHQTLTGAEWSIKAVDGRIVDIPYTFDEGRLLLDLSQCHAGLYILQYTSGKNVWRKKIIKE